MLQGSNFYIPIRDPLVMTTSDVRTLPFSSQLGTQAVFSVSITLGSATNCVMNVEFSNDKSTWFTEAIQVNSSGTVSGAEWQAPVYKNSHVFVANGNYSVAVPVKARWCSATIRGTGTMTSSLVAVSVQSGIA